LSFVPMIIMPSDYWFLYFINYFQNIIDFL
jgi:hypothetical protein